MQQSDCITTNASLQGVPVIFTRFSANYNTATHQVLMDTNVWNSWLDSRFYVERLCTRKSSLCECFQLV